MREDILKFKVIFYSKDGITSPISDYLFKIGKSNPLLKKKAAADLEMLPSKYYNNSEVKPFKTGKIKFWELRVRSGNDICRFFFTIEEPNFIVVYGFTKKSQKLIKRTSKPEFKISWTTEKTKSASLLLTNFATKFSKNNKSFTKIKNILSIRY